jgi:hypothetical protein
VFTEIRALRRASGSSPAAGLVIEFCRVSGESEEVGDDFPERNCVPFDRGSVRADTEHRVKKGTDRNFGSICCRHRLRPRLIPRERRGLTIYDVRLPENGALAETDIGFWEVAKIFHFLATFLVHAWTVLTLHEPVPQVIEWL